MERVCRLEMKLKIKTETKIRVKTIYLREEEERNNR
jgi:hypothetical protein